MKNGYLTIGWILLTAVGGFKLIEYGYGAHWLRWSDSEILLVFGFAVLHLVIGFVKDWREKISAELASCDRTLLGFVT